MKTTQQPTMKQGAKRCRLARFDTDSSAFMTLHEFTHHDARRRLKFSLKYRIEADFEVNNKKVHATFEVDASSDEEARATVADLVNLNASTTRAQS